MRTMRAKIIRGLTRLALRQALRAARALAGRRTPIRSRTPKNPSLACAVASTRAYLSQKRKARAVHRPKRMPR